MRGSDVDSKIEAHLIETIIDSGGRENVDGSIIEAESLEGGGEICQNPFGRFARVTTDEDFCRAVGDDGISVVGEAGDDFGDELWGELAGFPADAVSAEIFHVAPL